MSKQIEPIIMAAPSTSGMLVLSLSTFRVRSHHLAELMKRASKHVSKTLYVQPQQVANLQPPLAGQVHVERDNHDDRRFHVGNFVRTLYSVSNEVCGSIDVRLLMNNLKQATPTSTSQAAARCRHGVGVFLTTDRASSLAAFDPLELHANADVVSIDGLPDDEEWKEAEIDSSSNDWKIHDNLCLGGTFDRLHNGHKILLGEALLLCRKRLTIGVTDDRMIKKKMLHEIIEPLDVRIKVLRDFLEDVDATVSYNILPLSDPFGPSIVDASLQCIVVSEETLKGGQAVNAERLKKGMKPLVIHTIGLLAGDQDAKDQDKLSSTGRRMQDLGKRKNLSLATSYKLPRRPYLVGLTGGIASGKSSIARRLSDLGAGVIDCDKLAHAAYLKGTRAYDMIIEHFGAELAAEDGQIDRKILGRKVFGNKKELDTLNAIVWPEVQRLVDAEVLRLASQGVEVVVIEAALMVESGWFKGVHELWVAIIPREEAIKRIVNRDGVDAEHAGQRIDRQLTNEERLVHANVVFCTLWDPDFTQTQVETAWFCLKALLKTQDAS